MRADIAPAYTSFQPGSPPNRTESDDSPSSDDVGPQRWDPQHGFRGSTGDVSPMKTVRRIDRRRPAGANPAPETDDAEAPERPEQDDTAASMRYVPAAGPRLERPPSDLVDIVRQATGVDVSGARIDRSPEVSDRAASIGAIAFTESATVHLPSELGPSGDAPARAVLAHELTHVAQQRHAGGTLPAEDSPEGRELEHQARACNVRSATG